MRDVRLLVYYPFCDPPPIKAPTMKAATPTLLIACLLACSSTDPSPSPIALAGTWTVTFNNVVKDTTVACTLAPLTLTVTQDTTSLSGSYTALEAACGEDPFLFLPAPSTATGNLDGTDVSVDLGATPPLLSLQGSATVTDSAGTSVIHTLDGTFTAPGTTLAGEWSASRP
jgi:hypothetical protein